jgi:serine/threonine protein kinase
MDLGSLKEVIHDWKHIDYDELVIGAAAFQMLWGLAYLHYERRLHRDIKPQVSALSRYFVPLSDFNVSFGNGCSCRVLVPVAQ